MKISLDWLTQYIDIDLPPEQVAKILSDLGFPTESIQRSASDTIIDIEVTSNRGDCLSYIGVAREIAAATVAMVKKQLPGLYRIGGRVAGTWVPNDTT